MNLELLSFVLALIVGGLCYFLVKRTADAFDRWYDEQTPIVALRVPTSAR